MSERTMLLANILGGINDYITNHIDDEGAYMEWVEWFPDMCDEDELIEIAEDVELAEEIIKVGARIMYTYGKRGRA